MAELYKVTRKSTKLIMGENVFPVKHVVETVELVRLDNEIKDHGRTYAHTRAWGNSREWDGSENNVSGAVSQVYINGQVSVRKEIDFSECKGGGIKMDPANVARFIGAAELSCANRE